MGFCARPFVGHEQRLPEVFAGKPHGDNKTLGN